MNPPMRPRPQVAAAWGGSPEETWRGRWGSRPRIELFGGEPTVRDDLFDIIRMARQNGLPVSVVTNSVKLADEQYCKEMCDAKVDLILAFDGRDPEIYERMRGSRAAYYTCAGSKGWRKAPTSCRLWRS